MYEFGCSMDSYLDVLVHFQMVAQSDEGADEFTFANLEVEEELHFE